MATTESLFSLEIHVESVEELQLICRLPAVSFRLLDFPTLIIHHVSPIMAEKLRQKVLVGAGANESPLKELRDRHGNFQFQKGKSCLFKANIDVLQTQLQTTPLYVMLLDLWPKKPKLMGSGGIEIKTAVDVIHKQVREKGVAIPSFYKEFGYFDLFNLMGSAIARVKLGYRLVSLGGSLIPHVPKTTDSRQPGESQGLTRNIEERILEESDIITRDSAQVELKNLCVPEINQVSEQHDTYTQTLPVQKSEEHDLIVTNTVCPPPLYFNSLSGTQTKSNTETSRGGRESPAHINTNPCDAYDRDAGLLDVNALQCTSVSVQTDPTVNRAQQTVTATHQPIGGLHSLFTVMGSLPSRYPVLNALFQELSSVTTQQHKDESRGPSSSREAEPFKHNEETLRLTTMPAKPKILQGVTTTQEAEASVSKKSSVIGLPRRRIRFKPTNLTYKTTRTQRMRLELNLKGRVDGVRPCVAVNQCVTTKQTSKQTPTRDLGRTYKKDLDQAETIVGTAEQAGANGAQDKTMSKGREGTDTVTQPAEAQRTSEHSASPVGSIVGSARSQNSLEIFLPTVDGETDDSSYIEDPHLPLDSKFGHTGIPTLDAVPCGIQLSSPVTAQHEDFDDTMPWHDHKTDDSAVHSSLEISESHISDNAPKQTSGVGKSEDCRPLISKSPQMISRSHRPKSADSLIQKVSLSYAYSRETRSSTDLLNSEEIPQHYYNKQSSSSQGDESYSDDFHSGSEVQQGESEDSDSHTD